MKYSKLLEVVFDFTQFFAIGTLGLLTGFGSIVLMARYFHWESLWEYHFVGLAFVALPIYGFGKWFYLPKSSLRALQRIRRLDPEQVSVEMLLGTPEMGTIRAYFRAERSKDNSEVRSIKCLESWKHDALDVFSIAVAWCITFEGLAITLLLLITIGKVVPVIVGWEKELLSWVTHFIL